MPSAPILERALAIPAVATLSAACPQLFLAYQEKLSPRVRLGATARRTLEAFTQIDVKSERITDFLEANPYYGALFLEHVQAISRREDLPGIAASVVLLGMENSRNLLVALTLQRAVNGGHPTRDDKGKLEIVPKEMLKAAISTEALLQNRPNPQASYPETAYLGGLVFDLLQILAAALHSGMKPLGEYLARLQKQGAAAGQFAFTLSAGLQDFNFKKLIRPAVMIQYAGRGVMALLLPEAYLQFEEQVRELHLPIALRIHLERQIFGVDHALMGFLFCHDLGVFKQVEQAILHYHEPYLLKANKSLWQLASMIFLALNVANRPGKPTTLEDPIFQFWLSREIEDFPISKDAVLKALA